MRVMRTDYRLANNRTSLLDPLADRVILVNGRPGTRRDVYAAWNSLTMWIADRRPNDTAVESNLMAPADIGWLLRRLTYPACMSSLGDKLVDRSAPAFVEGPL